MNEPNVIVYSQVITQLCLLLKMANCLFRLALISPGVAYFISKTGTVLQMAAVVLALADAWPRGGPPERWERDLGGGHGGIAADESSLFTLVRVGPEEVAIALDLTTGATRWRSRCAGGSTGAPKRSS